MIPGFNHNIQHKGKTYHIQTEDSGLDNPHIITLLYLNGTIIAKKKTSYADIIKVDQLPQVVRELMQEQHKSMLRHLIRGGYDNLGQERDKNEDSLSAPIQPASISQERPSMTIPEPPPAAAPAPPPSVESSTTNMPLAAAKEIKAEDIGSLFGSGEDGNEKSLDEIILGYLTEQTNK